MNLTYMYTKCLLTTTSLYSESDITTLFNGDKGAAKKNGALESIANLVDGYGKGGMSIAKNAVLYIVVIALIIAIAFIALHARNSGELSIDKKAIPIVIVCLIGIFAISGIVNQAKSIGESAFTVEVKNNDNDNNNNNNNNNNSTKK